MGLCHDVNGRVASLGAVIQLVELGEPIPPSFSEELDRLEDVARRMTLLVGHVEAAPTPFDIGILLERAVDLQRHLKDLSQRRIGLNAEPGLPAVLVNEGRCFRTLALFVDLAVRLGADTIALGGTAEGVQISFEIDADALDRQTIAALDRLAAADGGNVAHDGRRCSLRLTSLSRARSAGR